MKTLDTRQHPGCLSAWRVSQLAADLLDAATRATAEGHLATCPRCRERVAVERTLVERALVEPVPPSLAVIARRQDERLAARRRWWRALPVIGVLAVAALALIIAQPHGATGPEPDTVRAKGALTLEATVQRQGEVVFDQQRLDSLGVLQHGDRLRLHLRNAAGSVKVEGLDGGTWATLFEGPVPADGWLPLGLAVDNTSETALRVTVCVSTDAPPSATTGPLGEPACETLTQRLDVR